MSPQRQVSGSPARSSIEVRGSDSEEFESDTQGDESMDESMADESRVEVYCTQLSNEDDAAERPSRPGDDGDSSSSPSEAGTVGPRFRGASQGPLGAVAAVNNKQILVAQARETEDLIRSIEAGDGQASMADDYTEWAGLNADLDKLIKDKEALHEYVKKTAEKVELRHDELHEWTAKLSTLADVDPHKLVSSRDRLPANLGPALLRLVTFYFQDDDSIDKLPARYKDLLGKDVHLLAQKALPPAPSQDVTVLRKELASARGDAVAVRHAVADRDSTIRALESDRARQASAEKGLKTKIDNLVSRYNDASKRSENQFKEKERELSGIGHECRALKAECKGLKTMLVQAEEEKKRLSSRADDALKSVEQKDTRIKQLDDELRVLTAIEAGSRPALDVLKDSLNALRDQNEINNKTHQRTVKDMQEKAQSQQDRQQRKITQLEDDVTILKRENGSIRELERDKKDLQQQVLDLTDKNKTLSTEVEDGTRRGDAACEEKRALEERNSELDATTGNMRAQLHELTNTCGRLRASEASLVERVEKLKQTIRENDSARDTVVQDLRNEVDSLESMCGELRADNNVLKQDAQTAERSIKNAQLQLNSHTQVTADLARHRKKVESLERDKEDGSKRLQASDEEKTRIQSKLDASVREVETLRGEARGDKAKIDKLAEEKAGAREKIRGLDDKLRNADIELSNQRTTVASLYQQLRGKEEQVKSLLADVTRLGSSEDEHKRSLGIEQGRVKDLQAQVSAAERSLDSEQQRVAQLGKDKEDLSASIRAQRAEAAKSQEALQRSLMDESARIKQLMRDNERLDGSISHQKRQADDARKELLLSADKERDRVQQLQGTVAELKDSVKSLQDQRTEDARKLGALDASLQHEKSERGRLRGHAMDTSAALTQLRGEHQLHLESAEAQSNIHHAARRRLVGEADAHRAEAERKGREVAQLTTRLSATEDLLRSARSEAQESVQGLQSFLSRLCGAPPGGAAVCEGLARQLQTPGTLETQEPARGTGWVILEAWGDEPGDEATQPPQGLEMLILELFRAAAVGRVGTGGCNRVLQKTVEAVSAGQVIHTGMFGEMAKVLVQAITAQPDEGFETGLAFWQVLDIVQHRWGVGDLDPVRCHLATSLRAHEYGSVFEVVGGRGQFQQCDDCHFFSDAFAVFARPAQSRAVLINVKDQSIRFFSKSRWTHGLRGCTVSSLGDRPGVFLPSNSVHDTIWADRMF